MQNIKKDIGLIKQFTSKYHREIYKDNKYMKTDGLTVIYSDKCRDKTNS